jgi:hypothetical protein
MAKKAAEGTVTVRADDSVWQNQSGVKGGWKQIKDGRNTTPGSTSRYLANPDEKTSTPDGYWEKFQKKHQLDGWLPAPEIPVESVDVDLEGDIDSKPVLTWRSADGTLQHSFTRAHHLRRNKQVMSELGKHWDDLDAAFQDYEAKAQQGDGEAATLLATLLTGHDPEVFSSLTPDRMRIYRDTEVAKSMTLEVEDDDSLEKSDTRSPRNPNRVHFAFDHPYSGLVTTSLYSKTLADFASGGGVFSPLEEGKQYVAVSPHARRQYAIMNQAADVIAKEAPMEFGGDFKTDLQGVRGQLSTVSGELAKRMGHPAPPAGMSYVPTNLQVAVVEESGGAMYWPDTFPKHDTYDVPAPPADEAVDGASEGTPPADDIEPELVDETERLLAEADEVLGKSANRVILRVACDTARKWFGKATTQDVVSVYNILMKEEKCEPSEPSSLSSEPSASVEAAMEKSEVTTTTPEAPPTETATPSPEPSPTQGNPHSALFTRAAAMALSMGGNPHLVAKALTIYEDHPAEALELIQKSATVKEYPAGTIRTWADGTKVKKVGDEWVELSTKKPSASGTEDPNKKADSTRKKLAARVESKLKELSAITTDRATDVRAALSEHLKRLKGEQEQTMKSNPIYKWKQDRIAKAEREVTTFFSCANIYTMNRGLIALTHEDTPNIVKSSAKFLAEEGVDMMNLLKKAGLR